MKTITFIGNGNMALSIAQGIKESYNIEVVGRSMQKLDEFELKLGIDIKKYLIDDFNIDGKTIMLCVKPSNIQEVATKLKGNANILYSVLAGVSIEKLKYNFEAQSVIRAMPNLAATMHKSTTSLCGDIEYKDESIKLFSLIGDSIWLESQNELDIATALAGSGAAYLALVAEALMDGAVKEGMKRDDAMKICRGLFDGFSPLLKANHPSILKDLIMSAGGTTAAGYEALEKQKVRYAFMSAIKQAYLKAKELSK